MINRWNSLKPREKALIWHFIVLGEKRYTAGKNLGISMSRVAQMLDAIYRLLGVRDCIELAFLVGRNYEQIEMDVLCFETEVQEKSK